MVTCYSVPPYYAGVCSQGRFASSEGRLIHACRQENRNSPYLAVAKARVLFPRFKGLPFPLGGPRITRVPSMPSLPWKRDFQRLSNIRRVGDKRFRHRIRIEFYYLIILLIVFGDQWPMERPIHKSTSIHFLGNVVSNGFQIFRTPVTGIFDSIVLLL